MEQFRHIGEVVGSLKALMVLRDEIQINQRQCCLILDIFSLAMDTIAEEIRQNLKLEERNTKWKPLEFPLKELCRVFKEGELYIRQCLDSKDWLGKAITLSHNRDCVEFHIHNLLCYFPAVIEAIEDAGEISGLDPDEKGKKKVMLARKYDAEWNDPKLFQWRFGKQYLVPREICEQLENAWREDRWRLIEAIKDKTQKKGSGSAAAKVAFTKSEQRLADMMLKKLLNGSEIGPTAVLVGSKDYQVRRRLGRGREFKEIQWLGHSFALRHFQGDRKAHEAEVSTLLSLSHPNILQYLCEFYDEEKKEFSLIMELMNKDLWTYMKENCGPRRQILFSVPVVVDLMLQIARGMEYLHSKKICHGHLNPCNILLRARNSQEGCFQAKVSGFGLSSLHNGDANEDVNPLTWYAPEVLTELEQTGNAYTSTSEKADAYSFGMICFELLTGKVPFEDNHLQGDRTSQNIKAGERPLFPYRSPKYLVSLIKKCWQTDPAQRPTFSSICRILRYTKKLLAMSTEYHVINPESNQLELLAQPVDCCDIEATFLKSFPMEMASGVSAVSQIPYEMFAYKVAEKGKMSSNNTKDKCCDCEPSKDEPSGCRSENDDQNTVCGDDNASTVEDPLPLVTYPTSVCGDTRSVCSEAPFRKTVRIKKPTQVKAKKEQGTSKLRVTKSLPSSFSSRVLRTTKANQPSLAPSTLSPGRRRPPLVSESGRNSKGNQSPLVSIPSSSVRRKKSEGSLSDSKSSLKLRKRDQSPLTRYGSATDCLKMKKSQLTLNPSLSPGRLRRANIENNLKGLTPTHELSTSRPCTSKRRGGHVSDLDSVLKKTTGRLSSLALSPLSPYVRRKKTCGHVSDSDSSFVKNRGSLSPFALSPLSPYVRTTCGHVSD
ncbi:Light-sensor Protein kinase [Spatholobus suberectus]|nr:Light-sensor Protein kinase [Spatholobus suberectus]